MFRPRHFAAALFRPRLFPGGGGLIAAIASIFIPTLRRRRR